MKEELPMGAMFVNGSERYEQSLYRTFHRCSYQVLVHLSKRFQRRIFFRIWPKRNKNGLCWPWLLTDSTIWAIFIKDFPKVFPNKFCFIQLSSSREDFLNWLTKKTRIAYGGRVCKRIRTRTFNRWPFRDASYKVLVHLV